MLGLIVWGTAVAILAVVVLLALWRQRQRAAIDAIDWSREPGSPDITRRHRPLDSEIAVNPRD